MRTLEKDGYLVTVEEDDDETCNPREMYDNLGTIIYQSSDYTLGDERVDLDDFIDDMAKDIAECHPEKVSMFKSLGATIYEEEIDIDDLSLNAKLSIIRLENIIIPVYAYIHSGVTISTGSFNDTWDSGMYGFIYVPLSKVKEEYGEINRENIEKVKEYLRNEIKVFDKYLKGEVYWCRIDKLEKKDCLICGGRDCEGCNEKEWKEYDSCGGFIGIDSLHAYLNDTLPEEVAKAFISDL